MVPALRKKYNDSYTQEKYNAFLKELDELFPNALEFHVAETPIFIPKEFASQIYDACGHIIDRIVTEDFKSITNRSIPETDLVPGENTQPEVLIFDFGICENDQQVLQPQLIEMQAFPSLFGFQTIFPELLRKHFEIDENYTQYLGDYNIDTYREDFKSILFQNHLPEEVILLEIKPHEQKTKIDFYCSEKVWGIRPTCITEVYAEGDQLFYELNGKPQRIKRIYNRVIFDELNPIKDSLELRFNFNNSYDVEWLPHPNWFYRVSKFTLPLLHHPNIPFTQFLNEVKEVPEDLENYVLKPLFSFAGQGVVIDVTPEDIQQIKDPENWILQKKVNYKAIIETPDEPAKAEIRIMYLWKPEWDRPKPAINLARLSKGKMIGVRYNQNKTWVGGTVAFVEKP